MNILIPMAGMGTRFPTEKYPMPKPLIEISGEKMIHKAVKSLNLKGNYFFVIAKTKYSEEIKESVKSVVSNSKFIEIDYITEGPACSALLFKNEINNDDELIIANCDQIMEWNSKNFLHNIKLYDGAMVTYHSDTKKNSYASVDQEGFVTAVKEKEVISNISLNGIHYWKKGKYFIESAEEMVNSQDRANNGEFYIGPTYNYMIKKGLKVGIHHIPNQQHHPIGVPEDLKKYIEYVNKKT